MSRRQVLLSTGVLAIVTAAVVALCLRSGHERRWQGKAYSEWFAEFHKAKKEMRQIPMSIHSIKIAGQSRVILMTNFYEDPRGWLESSAAKAIRSLGTNIVPYLESEIRHEDSRWNKYYNQWYVKFPRPLKRLAPNPPGSRDDIRMDAGVALSLLRGEASSAWPTLFRAYVTASPFTRGSFEQSLRSIPVEPGILDESLASFVLRGDMDTPVRLIGEFGVWNPNSVNILTNALLTGTNMVLRETAAAKLRYCRRYAPLIVPGLRVALKDERNPSSVRQSVLGLLEWIGPDATNALPELLETLKSRDPELRYQAARAIEGIGTYSSTVMPALTAVTNDPNPMVQRVVSRILGRVERNL